MFFAALGGVAFSSGADAAAGGFFAAAGSNGVRPRARGFLPGWGLPRHESVLDRVSDSCLLYRDRLGMRHVVCGVSLGARATRPSCEWLVSVCEFSCVVWSLLFTNKYAGGSLVRLARKPQHLLIATDSC